MSADRQTPRIAGAAAGFTLLEVIVALAIAALGLIGLFEAGSGGLVAADTAARIDEAVERAQSHLAAFAQSGALTPGRVSGDDGGGYRWEVQARPIAQQTPAAGAGPQSAADIKRAGPVQALYDIEVTISWHGARRNRSVVLHTRRLGPMLAAP